MLMRASRSASVAAGADHAGGESRIIVAEGLVAPLLEPSAQLENALLLLAQASFVVAADALVAMNAINTGDGIPAEDGAAVEAVNLAREWVSIGAAGGSLDAGQGVSRYAFGDRTGKADRDQTSRDKTSKHSTQRTPPSHKPGGP
jgi:hypothetical protein